MSAKAAAWASGVGRSLCRGLVSMRSVPFRSAKKASKFSKVVPDTSVQALQGDDMKIRDESTVDTKSEEPTLSWSLRPSGSTEAVPSNDIAPDDISYGFLDSDSECGEEDAADSLNEVAGAHNE